MQRKAKDELKNQEEKKLKTNKPKKAVSDKEALKASSKKASTTISSRKAKLAKAENDTTNKTVDIKRKSTSKKAVDGKTKKTTSSSHKSDSLAKTEKKSTTSKKVASSKKATISTREITANKKNTNIPPKNAASKRTTTKKRSNRKTKEPIIEYYDLPALYNQTLVKILAQTPSILFVYWDVSEELKQELLKNYGEYFFYDTTPFLIVNNATKDYSFEVEINDYANSWYIKIPDSDCKYDVSLVRKPKNDSIKIENEYIYITSSNELKTPNDHILFEQLGKNVFFKNIVTGEIKNKDISSLYYMNKIGSIYNIYNLYKEIYENEIVENKLANELPSSSI